MLKKLFWMGALTWGLFINGADIKANQIQFTDVPSDHWAVEEINWALQERIIDGYSDGSFKPQQEVSPSEYLSMIIRAFGPADFSTNVSSKNWDQPYVEYAIKYSWNDTFKVPFSSSVETAKMSRAHVAELMTNVLGRNYNQEDSIRFLMDSKLAEGKSGTTVEGFKAMDLVTRAEALTFIHRLKLKSDTLYPSPNQELPYDPGTLSLPPAQVMPLEIHRPPQFIVSFNDMVFKTPQKGYEETKTAAFNIVGMTNKQVGDSLKAVISKKGENGFHQLGEENLLFSNKQINHDLKLSEGKGLYLVRIYSPSEIQEATGSIRTESKQITQFYINFD
ncbi:hypothetical protein J2T17_006358 [Paenibacillus mucilaginosus]|uniref:S-layer homology domain-containing protein n=1 Tax=Paenibacillus mucilaginosus TaxID=61624 RepID=UPI003D2373F2